MLARSVRNPLIISVGTGLVLVSGTAPAALAETTSASPSASASASTSESPSTSPSGGGETGTTDSPSPDPSESTPPPPPPPNPSLSVVFKHVPSSIQQGGSASLYVQVSPVIPKGAKAPVGLSLHVGSSKANVTFESGGKHTFAIKSLSFAKLVPITVSVPSNVSKGTVDVWAQADADNTPQASAKSLSIPVKAKPKSKSSSSGGSGSGSSGSTGSTGSTGSNASGAAGLPVGGTGAANGTGTTATPGNGSALLPSIAPQGQTPVTAPGTPVQNAGNSQSMRGTAEAANELTFDKLASTQAAWLAALLVAFSLLLTQIRLGRTGIKDPRQKGAHRRPRRPGSAH